LYLFPLLGTAARAILTSFVCFYRIMASVLSDLWMPCVVFVLLTASFITGVKKLVDAGSVSNTLMISIVWVVYNMIPQYLLIHYTWVGRGTTLQVGVKAVLALLSICP